MVCMRIWLYALEYRLYELKNCYYFRSCLRT